MDLLLDDEQQDIRKLAADFFLQNAGPARAHDVAEGGSLGPLIRSGAELGWFGLTVAEERGGLGLSPKELAIVFREAGRGLGPLRLLATTIAAITAEAAGADELLESILAGEAPAALSAATSTGHLLVDADDDTALVVHVDGATVTVYSGDESRGKHTDLIDPATPGRRVECFGEPLARAGADVAGAAALAIAALQVGIASACLDTAVSYAKERVAFGKPIGSFQAIKHRLADVAVMLEAADSQLFFAATACAQDLDGWHWEVDVTRVLSRRVATAATAAAIQVHGAMGITWEHDAHLFLERAHLLDHLSPHGTELARRILDGSAVAL
ncbi:acyl-CoA dehydrogenase family protein [Rhodococcus koreensis]